jgi:hypothetical protein
MRDDTCAEPLRPKPMQEVLAYDMVWCKTHLHQADQCLSRCLETSKGELSFALALGLILIILSMP